MKTNKMNIPINTTNKTYINNSIDHFSIDHFNINKITILYKRILNFDGYNITLTGIHIRKY